MCMTGNCDYEDWFKLDHSNFLVDTDKIILAFDENCHKAGPDKCAFYADSPSAVRQRRDSLLARLKIAPPAIPAWARESGPDMPELVTYSKVQLLVRSIIYKPLTHFPEMARVFAELEKGNGVPFYDFSQKLLGESDNNFCTLNDISPELPSDGNDSGDAFPAIMCADGTPLVATPEEFAEYADLLQKTSKYAGATNVHFRMLCNGRQIRPKWRFAGECAPLIPWLQARPMSTPRQRGVDKESTRCSFLGVAETAEIPPRWLCELVTWKSS